VRHCFIETGFLSDFSAGDSLLITAAYSPHGQLHLAELLMLVPLCAIAGDQIDTGSAAKPGRLSTAAKTRSFFASATCNEPRFYESMAERQ